MLFFWLFAVVSAQNERIPDPPKIDLDISTLRLYGFQPKDIIEINRPGQLDRLMSKKLNSNITDITQLLAQGYDSSVTFQGFVNSSQYTLDYFSKRPEGGIVSFFDAHFVNFIYRLFQRLVDFDNAAVETIMNLTEYDNTKRITDYCKRNIIVQAIAAQTVGGSSQSSCDALAQQTLSNPQLLQSYVIDAITNKITIIRDVRQLEAGEVSILPLIAPVPITTTSLLQKSQVHAMKDAIKDYVEFTQKIENNQKFNSFVLFGKTMGTYRQVVMEKVNTFFSYYP